MSFKPEVIADSSGKFCGNALRFATREEAEANVKTWQRAGTSLPRPASSSRTTL
jgi:hypothetical protein